MNDHIALDMETEDQTTSSQPSDGDPMEEGLNQGDPHTSDEQEVCYLIITLL